MASIQDVANAAYRIKESAAEVQARSFACAEDIHRRNVELRQAISGSRTGENASSQVDEAERSLREFAVRLISLQSSIDRFITDLTK